MNAKLTKADYARRVGIVLRRVSAEAVALAEGMWNPTFCESDADSYAETFCSDLQAHIDQIRAALAAMKTEGR